MALVNELDGLLDELRMLWQKLEDNRDEYADAGRIGIEIADKFHEIDAKLTGGAHLPYSWVGAAAEEYRRGYNNGMEAYAEGAQ